MAGAFETEFEIEIHCESQSPIHFVSHDRKYMYFTGDNYDKCASIRQVRD